MENGNSGKLSGKAKLRSILQKLSSMLLIAGLAFACLPASALAAEGRVDEARRVVRVGYYPVTEYQDKYADGRYFGFSYDYYMQIEKYTGWDYDFVEASYADCMKMLAAGELDVVSGVIPTDTRRETMSFSHYSVSNTQNKLYARIDDADCFYESYPVFDGRTVAVMRGTLPDMLLEYGRLHHFQVTLKEYDTLSEMEAALLAGEVDLLCATSIAQAAQTKIVARLDKISLHYAVSEQAPEVLEELDTALQKIIDNNPYFYTQMSEKYMVSGANAIATFTKEEDEYIKSGRPVYVIMNDRWAPVCWYDGEHKIYRGIVPDILARITEYSGLSFVCCNETDFNAAAAKDPTILNDVLAILADDNAWASEQNVMMTNRIVDSSIVMVTRRSTHQMEFDGTARIALPRGFYSSAMISNSMTDSNIHYFSDVEECLKAVNSGKADAAFVNELVSTYFLSMMEYSDLFATANSGYDENLAFAVNKDTQYPLLGVMDKSLLCLGKAELNQIIIQNSVADQRFSVKGLFYADPVVFMLVVVAAMVMLGGIVILLILQNTKRRRLSKELETEQENAAARTEFFMMISHELRTPLNAIVGYLNMAVELCPKDSPEKEYLRRSQGAARQLSDVAEDMLDYTEIASSTASIHADLFDLKEVVYHVRESSALDAEKHNVAFQFKILNIDHEFVVGDKLRIAQMMQNLLSNSVKFTEAGGAVEAELEEKTAENGDLEIRFTAKDTGKGMSAEFLKKVCAPFNQSDPSYSRTHGGLGLGLFLTKYYLDAMGGRMEVRSEIGKGSAFTVWIPVARANSEQLLRENVDYSHVRALIGGEDQDDNKALKDLLGRLKMKCDLVASAELAVRRIKSRLATGYAYSLCVVDEDLLDETDSLLNAIASIDGAPAVFVMTNGKKRISVPEASKETCRILSKPIFQSVLFDAVMSSFGAYIPEETANELPDYTGVHVMIVEDNRVNADILSRMLMKMNAEVTVCENGKLALEAFVENPEKTFALILMDIQMPVMGGCEAAMKIRGCAKGDGATVPIVAVSANAFPEDKAKSLQAGMNAHLSKPIERKQICAVIETYCIHGK